MAEATADAMVILLVRLRRLHRPRWPICGLVYVGAIAGIIVVSVTKVLAVDFGEFSESARLTEE
jgi:hypothetical protein